MPVEVWTARRQCIAMPQILMTTQVDKLEQNIPRKVGPYKGRAVPFWSQFFCSVVTTQVQKQGQTVLIFLGRTVDHQGLRTPLNSFWELSIGKLCETECCIRHKESPPWKGSGCYSANLKVYNLMNFLIFGPPP